MTSPFAQMRARLVERLRARGDVRSAPVASAFTRVPRHVFVPSVSAEDAYADRSIAIKLEDGVPISSSSQPAIMAEMLEMLDVRRGDRVLEIGAGSGYNAALLAELAGPGGSVVSVDIDRELGDAARERLAAAGYARVRVLCGDGALGVDADAPFDRIVASVGVDRIPPAWIAQLRIGGRLVAPLTLRTIQKVVAFARTPGGLESDAAVDAAFMMLRGPSASSGACVVELGGAELTLTVLPARAAAIDAGAVAAALRGPYDDAPAARRIAPDEAWSPFAMWLAVADDAFCRVSAYGTALAQEIVPSLVREIEAQYGAAVTVGVCERDELAVLARARDVVVRRYASSTGAAERMQAAIAAWHRAGRPGNTELRVRVAPDGTASIGFAAP